MTDIWVLEKQKQSEPQCKKEQEIIKIRVEINEVETETKI